jgi:hypothetical protein
VAPLGSEKTCIPQEEIPVGQTVDNAENWAKGLINNPTIKDIQNMIDKMNQIGQAIDPTNPIKNYCGCAAKFDTTQGSGPICKTNCNYSQWFVPESTDDSGDVIPAHNACSCAFVPCKGSPCEQMTDYFADLLNDYRQLKTDFITLYTNGLKETRSDILKELEYSRKETNSCSLTGNAYGLQKTRLLDCTRVEDEIIPPERPGNGTIINDQTYKNDCYGTQLGKLLDMSMTDNWFCCDEISTSPTTSNNPIYNITE